MFKQLRRRRGGQAGKISPRHHGWPVVPNAAREKIAPHPPSFLVESGQGPFDDRRQKA
jgi:hypothetical protein